MSKGLKVALVTIVPLMLVLGTLYGLAKINVIPVQQMGRKQPALGSALRLIGLYHPSMRPRISLAANAPDPLAPEKQALKAERDALEQERTTWDAQRQAQQRTEEQAKAAAAHAAPDPKELARLASIYEQMPPDAVNKIFIRLPEDEVIALLRRMDEKQAAQILGSLTPEKAARLTQALAQPAPSDSSPQQTAANTP